jgi:uncharacterized protein (DUF2252 family)
VSAAKPKGVDLDLLDAAALAARQLAGDEKRTKHLPQLLDRKLERMGASPFAFLRGAAPLFYEMLAARPELGEGPGGEGWLVGDLHLENFGAYRPKTAGDWEGDSKKPASFDLNDFDDAIVGPWRIDLLRLVTSLLLGIRPLVQSGNEAVDLCDRLLDAWTHAAFDGKALPAPPAPVTALMEKVRSRSRAELLDGRTAVSHGKRHFVRGPRYADLPKDVLDQLPHTFERYVASTPEDERPDGEKHCLEIVDAAFRIAGTGSLGALRIAVLTEGKGGPNGSYVFDLKEQGTPSGAVLFGAPDLEPAERVLTGYRSCLEHPPRMMGQTHLGKTSMLGRRLAPQEDKLAFEHVNPKELPELASYLGALVGRAHARGATKAPRSRWSRSDRDALCAHAFTLAGIHEAVYLAICERTRKRSG